VPAYFLLSDHRISSSKGHASGALLNGAECLLVSGSARSLLSWPIEVGQPLSIFTIEKPFAVCAPSAGSPSQVVRRPLLHFPIPMAGEPKQVKTFFDCGRSSAQIVGDLFQRYVGEHLFLDVLVLFWRPVQLPHFFPLRRSAIFAR